MATASTRLSEQHRKTLLRRLVSNKFAKRMGELDKELQTLAQDIYRAAFSVEDHLTIERLVVKRPDWLPRVKFIRARLGEKDVRLELGMELYVPNHKRAYHDETPALMVCGYDNGFTKRYYAIEEEKAALTNEKDKLTSEIRHVLNSSTTANALINKWPEIKQLVDEVCVVRTELVCISAPLIQNLNKALGLATA